MRLKKRLLLTVALAGIALNAGGCVDMIAVPGVGILPGDDHQVVFLEANQVLMQETLAQGGTDRLVIMEITGGDGVAYYDGETSGGIVTGFAVHPLENAVAYVVTEDGVGTSLQLAKRDEITELANFPLSNERGLAFGLHLTFSPDGRYLALALLELPAAFSLADFELVEEIPTILNPRHYAGYLLDMTSLALTPLNDPTTEALTTFAWNPMGTHLAYTVYVDTDGNGQIAVSPFGSDYALTYQDYSQIRIREIATGAITPIHSETVDIGPEFLSDDRLAYIAYAPELTEENTSAAIQLYDMPSAEITPLREGADVFIGGLAVSPDYSRVAWVEYPLGVISSSYLHGSVLLSDLTFGEPIRFEITELSGALDVPVWIPDANAVLVTASSLGGAFMRFFEESEALPNALVRLDLETGEQTVLTEVDLFNSAVLSGWLGLFATTPS